jgi:hypothetical protein
MCHFLKICMTHFSRRNIHTGSYNSHISDTTTYSLGRYMGCTFMIQPNTLNSATQRLTVLQALCDPAESTHSTPVYPGRRQIMTQNFPLIVNLVHAGQTYRPNENTPVSGGQQQYHDTTISIINNI